MLRAGARPIEPYPGVTQKPWRCECMNCRAIITPYLHSVRAGHEPCRTCALERSWAPRVLSHEDAAEELKRLGKSTPLETYPGRLDLPWRCQCDDCGTENAPRLGNIRMRGGSACQTCGWKRGAAAQMFNSKEAAKILLRRGAEPAEPYPGYSVPWSCVCLTCHREIRPTLGNAIKGHNPCAHCTGNARFSDAEAGALMCESGAIPQEPYPGANKKWHCICNECKRDIYPTFANAKKFSACKYCADHGYDYKAPSVVYLLRLDIDEWLSVLKVGVANNDSGRIPKHESRGWVVLDVVDTLTGEEALAVERDVIRGWRSRGLEPIARHLIPVGDGWTETANADEAAGWTPTLEAALERIRVGRD